MRLSIRYKILFFVGTLLLSAVGFYTVLASFIFAEQKTTLLFDINHSSAINTAAQIRSSLLQAADQMRLFAITELIAKKNPIRIPAQTLTQAFVLKSALYKKTGNDYTAVPLPKDVPQLQLQAETLRPFLEGAVQNQYAFFSNHSLDNPDRNIAQAEDSRFFLAARLDITTDNNASENFVLVGQIANQLFVELLQSTTLFESFLVTSSGETLIHVNRTELEAPQSLVGHPLLDQIQRGPASSGLRSFDYEGKTFVAGYAPVGIGNLWLLNQADQSEIRSSLALLIQRSLLFGLIVATLTFIASILFSKRLTRNLNLLAARAEQIGSGNWDSKIQIRSGDEVETLATSFNTMVEALKASREAIEKYNRELEDKVALRTQQLKETNATIKEVQEKLLSTTQLAAVGEVAGRTAHELLNPLTAIISRLERSLSVLQPAMASPTQLIDIVSAWQTDYQQGGIQKLAQSLETPSTVKPNTSLLQEDLENLRTLAQFWTDQSQVLSKDITFVQEQAQRIHRIIDRMREYVRSSTKDDVHCHEVAEAALITMEDFLSKNGVKVLKQFDATADLAYLNRDELIQILTNLIRNAFQSIQVSSRSRKGEIRVRTLDRPGEIAVQVIDNGGGVPKDIAPKLFEAGFTTKGPSEGTGLGLSICRRYARAFGGEVSLVYSEPGTDTEPGRGTCFQVNIPLKGVE